MILGMTLFQFKVLHTSLSAVGILTGLLVLSRMVRMRPLGASNMIFLWATILTSVTGFFFPFSSFGPAHYLGVISLVVMAFAAAALWIGSLYGTWRPIYVVSAALGLYFNIFVGVIMFFAKIPQLHAYAPTGKEPALIVTQLVALLVVALLGWGALRRFHPAGM